MLPSSAFTKCFASVQLSGSTSRSDEAPTGGDELGKDPHVSDSADGLPIKFTFK